jgi:flagellar biosynthesis protein FlhA
MPHIVFLPLGISGIVFAGYLIKTIDTRQVFEREQEAIAERQAGSKELDWDDVDQVEIISLDIGYGLVPLASTDSGGELLTRIKGIRKKVSAELGFLVQPIRIRDNLELRPENYSISLHGVQRGSGFVRVGKLLAIHGSEQIEGIEGERTEEPAFGLSATWIDPSKADLARTMGHTVVDAPTAIATHVSAIIKENAHELLGQDETQELLDKVSNKYPKLVSNLVPDTLTLATVSQVLKNLLIDQIPVRDMRSIIEALSVHGKGSDNAGDLVSLIRPSLGRMIVQPMLDGTGSLSVITLDPELEGLLEASKTGTGNEHVTIDPQLAKSFVDSLSMEAETLFDSGEIPSLVVSPGLRNWMAKFVRPRIPDLGVISYTEIPDDQKINVRASVGATATLDNS